MPSETYNKDLLLKLYKIRRTFCAIDEWGFYFFMMYAYEKLPLKLFIPSLFYGFLAIGTTYANLGELTKKIGFKDKYFLWPFKA